MLIQIETESARSFDPKFGGPSGKEPPPGVLPPGVKPPAPKRYVPMPPKNIPHTFANGENNFDITIE